MSVGAVPRAGGSPRIHGICILAGLVIAAVVGTIFHWLFAAAPLKPGSAAAALMSGALPLPLFGGLAAVLAVVGVVLDEARANIIARMLPRLAALCMLVAVAYAPLPLIGLWLCVVFMVIAPLGAGIWRQPPLLVFSWLMALASAACLWVGTGFSGVRLATACLAVWLAASGLVLMRSGRLDMPET